MMKDINIKYWGMSLINLISEVKKEHRWGELLISIITEIIAMIDALLHIK